MQELVQRLRDIELKIKTLGERYETLKRQNKQLKQENISLKKDLEQVSQDHMALIREVESAKSHMRDHKDVQVERDAIKKSLGIYMREVDKCITLMQDIS